MKKKITLFTLILLLCLQPITFNSNISLAKETIDPSEASCKECANKDVLTLNETGKLKNQKVIDNIKGSLINTNNFRESVYIPSDFDWDTAEFLDYGENLGIRSIFTTLAFVGKQPNVSTIPDFNKR